MVEWITIVLKTRWRIVEYALKTQTQKIRKLKKLAALWRQAPGDLQKWLWLLSTGAGRRVHGARRQYAARLCSSDFCADFVEKSVLKDI